MKTLELVREFQLAFGRPIHDRPELHNQESNELRVRLLREEVTELEEALKCGTEVDVLDALTDIQYILDGSYLALGFHLYKEAAFREVHKSNMNKLGPDGQPVIRADGKILKPEGWQPPNLQKVISILS